MGKLAVNLLLLFVCSVILSHPGIGNAQDIKGSAEAGEDATQGNAAETPPPGGAASDQNSDKDTPVEESSEPQSPERESVIDEIAREQNQQDDPSTVRISKVKIKGAKAVTKQQIEQIIGTDFPSIRFWVKKPVFDEEVLKDDMIRIQRLHASNGYYDAKVTYKLEYNKDKNRVEIKIDIVEGEPIKLTQLIVDFKGDLSEKIKKKIFKAIPLKADTIFSPKIYQQTIYLQEHR